jgi:hypothetical protein
MRVNSQIAAQICQIPSLLLLHNLFVCERGKLHVEAPPVRVLVVHVYRLHRTRCLTPDDHRSLLVLVYAAVDWLSRGRHPALQRGTLDRVRHERRRGPSDVDVVEARRLSVLGLNLSHGLKLLLVLQEMVGMRLQKVSILVLVGRGGRAARAQGV